MHRLFFLVAYNFRLIFSLSLIRLLFVHLLFAVLQHSIRREFLYFFPLFLSRCDGTRAHTHRIELNSINRKATACTSSEKTAKRGALIVRMGARR